MPKQIQKILIVGGGTAGWLSAAYLNRALGNSVEVSLVESRTINPIGVGEATLPTLAWTMKFLGFADTQWMPKIGATYKAAIRFVNWNVTKPGEANATYWHPFGDRPETHVQPYDAPFFPPNGETISILHYALKRRLTGNKTPIACMIDSAPALCDRKLSPKQDENSPLNIRTAYHVDAGLLADFLRNIATSRGVGHIVDDVTNVRLSESGHIKHITTQNGLDLTADLFIDCTGFRGLLLNQAMDEPFIGDSGTLLCDSAVAIPTVRDSTTNLPPYTTATALQHGWVWDVPLFHRHGCGYVYSSSHCSSSDAEMELRSFLGSRAISQNAKHLQMRVGRNRNWWKHNCIAIGLSGSFLEPLESTGIFFIELGLATLVSLFPDLDFHPARIKRYNGILENAYEEIRDFLVLHYYLNARNDSDFWRDARRDQVLPNSLRNKLELFEHSLPLLDSYQFVIFRAFSYSCILDGNNRLPNRPFPLLEHIGYTHGERLFTELRTKTERRIQAMPTHYQYLCNMGHKH